MSRPVNLFPLEREVINTEFLLVTRDDRRHRKLTLSGRKAARRQGFSARRQTKIIIHGFLDHGDVEWIKVGNRTGIWQQNGPNPKTSTGNSSFLAPNELELTKWW